LLVRVRWTFGLEPRREETTMQLFPQAPQAPQAPQPPQFPQTPGSGHDIVTMELTRLRAHADALKLRVSDLEMQVGQIAEERGRLSPAEREVLNKSWTPVNHELASTRIQLEATQKQISELETARDMARSGITLVPPLAERGLEMDMERERMIGAASFILLLPLVLAWSRRIWHRGAPRPSVDLEDSPRLQRMEQAIESIAVEVERIGEAQRFTTKLLADRQPEAAARLGAVPRREPGTITPH
jgi:hypothetical protein